MVVMEVMRDIGVLAVMVIMTCIVEGGGGDRSSGDGDGDAVMLT